jgi:molybdenum cofactor biosynthesis enzyme MoaA
VVTATTIRKVIDGREYFYDRGLDIIHSGTLVQGPIYDRTQVVAPVDLCVELSTYCNWSCGNCFSKSQAGVRGVHADVDLVKRYLAERVDQIIRVCVTGGEPLLHPHVESVLEWPRDFRDCAFVLSTNGSVRPELDTTLVEHSWLVAVSLHGMAAAHNAYTASTSFDVVRNRIRSLAPRAVVHIYTVLHDAMTAADIDWILRFRDDAGVAFVRFIRPRPAGRYIGLNDARLIAEVMSRLDTRSGYKATASQTTFLSAKGLQRLTN